MEILVHLYHAEQTTYVIALIGLFGFIAFWRVLNGGKATMEKVTDTAGTAVKRLVFHAPSDLLFHPGHAWARVEDTGIVTVGMNDFAAKLLGSADSISLPKVGSQVKQGSLGWGFKTDSRVIHMLSPIQGEVVAVNDKVANNPAAAFADPYGDGWILRVKSSDLTSNMKNMIPGGIAWKWFDNIGQTLAALGASQGAASMYEEGGAPALGIAKAVDPEGWDDLARRFFLTKGELF